MHLRQYRPSDCNEIIELFRTTVHAINAKDYTTEQLDAWAPRNIDTDQWNRSFLEHYTIVALNEDEDEDRSIVGFGDMAANGYLDRLYVHATHQGEGIATAICDELERRCNGIITVHASISAKPFFEHRGYMTVRAQKVIRRDVALPNYVMEKRRHITPAS